MHLSFPFLLQERSAIIGHSSQALGAGVATARKCIYYRTHEDFFYAHQCYLLLMYLATVYCVHICEKQLLQLFMNLLK